MSGQGILTHHELAAAAAEFAAGLGPKRRLVLLRGGNDLPSLIAYVAVLGHGHVAMLASDDRHAERLRTAFSPDTVIDHGVVAAHLRAPRHDLHPDLALLLSTSGSTGSPKLVRLSHANLRSNAEAITDYLRLTSDDLAATTLPPHYCYGLSVLHSHLHRGAALLVTDHSVTDPAFWEQFRKHHATSFAGVPYTFDLLDRIGFSELRLPHLRQVTQAGGRLEPERVRTFAEQARQRGFDFFVMYGATEATARMAWLPPDLAIAHPDAIGLPVPGGEFEILPLPEQPDGTGELVFHGPNVMLGYAESIDDLRLGRTVTRLHTGDIGYRGEDGLFRVVGRRSRFTKLFGLRIDLDECERTLARIGITAKCADGGDRLVVATLAPGAPADQPAQIRRTAAARWGLPPTALCTLTVEEFPRLANGKTDYRSLIAAAGSIGGGQTLHDPGESDQERILRLFSTVLDVPAAPHQTFTELGGDSLCYVEVSLRLEEILGTLPTNWHRLSVEKLAATAAPAAAHVRRRSRTVDMTVPLRAVAITAIVATHGNLVTLLGGAHLLLAISGFNFARFAPSGGPTRVLRARLRSLARIVVPSVLWIGAVALLLDTYPWRVVLLANGLLGPPGWSEPAWHYWFIEALVVILLVLALVCTLPWWRRLEHRYPFGLPMTLAGLGLITRYELWEPRGGDDIHRAHMIFWLFAMGWAAARARNTRERLLVSAFALCTVPGFFEDPHREAFLLVGLLLLVWVRRVRLPAAVASVTATLASASLYIYLTHWQVYPWLEDRVPLLAVLASLAVGVSVSLLVDRLPRLAPRLVSRFNPQAAAPGPSRATTPL